MNLLELIAHSDVLANPSITLGARGLKLTYELAADFERVKNSFADLDQLIFEDTSLIIPHAALYNYLIKMGLSDLGLNDEIDVYYLQQRVDRAERFAYESLNPAIIAKELTTECCELQNIAKGPRKDQLIAKVKIKMPGVVGRDDAISRVIFILDRSGSMSEQGRLDMLKPAVINTIEQLPPQTLCSIYFYNDELRVLFKNLLARNFDESFKRSIISIRPGGGTKMSSVMPSLIQDFRENGLLDNDAALRDVTVVWVTDGEDESLRDAQDLVTLFQRHGCLSMPKLIAVGVGDYNRVLLNGVAEDVRFKSNMMLHIDTPAQTSSLFGFVSQLIGKMRQHVILVIDVDGQMVYQDLGIMQAEQTKALLIALPMPQVMTTTISFRLLINYEIYQRIIALPADYSSNDIALLIEYFKQLQTKIVLATHNSPELARQMRQLALASIPSTTHNQELRSLRKFFMNQQETHPLQEEHIRHLSLFRQFDDEVADDRESQIIYSTQLRLNSCGFS